IQEKPGGAEEAYEKLRQLLCDAANPRRDMVRKEIAHILEFIEPSEVSDELFHELLLDKDENVRKGVLRTIARQHPPHLVPLLIELLKKPELRSEVREALSSYGPEILTEMRRVLENPAEPEE